MHRAQHYVDSQGAALRPQNKLSNGALNAKQATAFGAALNIDAESYLYSGLVCIGDAVQAVERGLFTWATVKLYYSVFYLCRARLAHAGVAVIYDGSKPYVWKARQGEGPKKAEGVTHKVVLNTFGNHFGSDILLSQTILAEQPLDWLMHRREEVNYKVARFTEPAAPAHFASIQTLGARRSVVAYIEDKTLLHAFDPEHAVLAYPIEMAKRTALMRLVPHDQRRYMSSLFCDKAGPIPIAGLWPK
jgi:hypothetical protein